MRFRLCVLVATWLVVVPGRAGLYAQELEPRAYTNTPVGLNFVLASYAHTAGGVAFEPTVPLTNARVVANSGFLAYVRAIDLGGMSGKFEALVPFSRVSGGADFQGQRFERSVAGPGDPRFRLSVNFYGAPALTMQEFANYQQDLIIGASLQVSVPLGRYDPDKLLNIGANRATARPELGLSKAVGPVTLELLGAVALFTENDNFFGGRTLGQAPIFSVQAHVIYGFRSGVWAALDSTYYAGGRPTLDGVRGAESQENARFGATLALPVNRNHSIKLLGSTSVWTRTGTSFDALGLAWQYRWGAGL